MTVALAYIRQDHLSLTGTLACVQDEVRAAAREDRDANFVLIEQALDYIDLYRDVFHQPKEDSVLFPLLRSRMANLAAPLDSLRLRNGEARTSLNEARRHLNSWKRHQLGAAQAFAAAFNRFADLAGDQLEIEETVFLPVAAAALTAQDWIVVNDAFLRDRDPLTDPMIDRFALLRGAIVAMPDRIA